MKQVNPSKYTKKYFTKDCGGHLEWNKSQGKQLPHRLKVVFNLSKIKKDMNVVDFGCGRGELSYQASLKGANVLGLDYSKEAVKLAKSLPKTTKGSLGFKLNRELKIPIKNNSIDMIFFVDVLEHLYPKQLRVLLKEFYRVLKPGGKVIIHTAPNRLYYDVGYPYYTRWISMLVNPFWKIIFRETLITNKILRTDYEREMHVNECTLGEVQQFFSDAKFKINAWLSSECQIFRKRDRVRYILLQPEFGPLKNFFSYDILGVASKPQK
jgi:2-polyprenyl-3-methyl-5-hydroxy-6-metoxy-1,4-benzoquinol methylase